MATTMYFEELVKDQNNKAEMEIEFGRSSYYAGCEVANGEGEDSIYLNVDGKVVIMDRATAKRFVEAAVSVGQYHGLLD